MVGWNGFKDEKGRRSLSLERSHLSHLSPSLNPHPTALPQKEGEKGEKFSNNLLVNITASSDCSSRGQKGDFFNGCSAFWYCLCYQVYPSAFTAIHINGLFGPLWVRIHTWQQDKNALVCFWMISDGNESRVVHLSLTSKQPLIPSVLTVLFFWISSMGWAWTAQYLAHTSPSYGTNTSYHLHEVIGWDNPSPYLSSILMILSYTSLPLN